ncbi:hypothetical protein MPDQ_001999 [Monascus purpureus]|uniref:Uncharacterized protein n=1 Tax=Monascus purpureus TaxID=5098 RepID=A0A507R2N9_MONPU|nr:hypothetical protein MPDQ_001999 [Monascus purpureus]BDD56352.1 hypothetical protein MAP00_001818 [Monascus purpureus]
MGIPMFREPSPCETSKNSTTIKDPSAASRSTIRRQTSVRRPNRYSTRGAPFRSHFPRQSADDNERDLLATWRHGPSSVPNRGYGNDALDFSTGLADLSRRDAGRRILSDVLRQAHPGRRLRIARESTLRPDLTSPLFSSDLLNHLSPGDDAGSQRSSEHLPFTPRFAPAIAYHSSISSQPPPDATRAQSFPRVDGPEDDTTAPTVPLLQGARPRPDNRGTRQRREPLVDGLGDRQRSLSPDDENDAWETLLTTITPDANLPSAESSFASGSVSATTDLPRLGVRRSPITSSQTLPSSFDSSGTTVPVVLDPYPEFLNPCDYPSSSDSEPDSDSEVNYRTLYRRSRDRLRRSHHLGSTMGSQPPIPTISVSFSHSSANPELQQMQAILDRLSRREDIPDDWWAAAGLSRTMSRRVHANDDSPDLDIPDGPLRERL